MGANPSPFTLMLRCAHSTLLLHVAVIRLKGRRTPHQDLKGPLIDITQPSISNQWATGGPPLVLISHPNGMTPDEERFYTENRSTYLSQKLGLDGGAHLPPLVKKKEQRDGALQWPSRSYVHDKKRSLQGGVPSRRPSLLCIIALSPRSYSTWPHHKTLEYAVAIWICLSSVVVLLV